MSKHEEALNEVCELCFQNHELKFGVESRACSFRSFDNEDCLKVRTLKELINQNKVLEYKLKIMEEYLKEKHPLKVENMQCPHCKRSFYNYEGMIDPTLQGYYCQFCGELLDWSEYE